MKLIKGTSFMFCFLVLSSCQNQVGLKKRVSRILISHPELVTEIIMDHPTLFVESLNRAGELYKEELLRQRQGDDLRRIEKSIREPLLAEINESMTQRGPMNAPITIVEYIDFECPYCERSVEVINAINEKFMGKVRVIYKHLPLPFHEMAYPAAQYFEAISLQNSEMAIKFHDAIFKEQTKLKYGAIFLDSAARNIGVNMRELKRDIGLNNIKERIKSDILEANRFGIKGTPGFIVNGVAVRGAYPPEHFFTLISELQKQGKVQL